ncbi:MAG: hypothetical protein GQ534_08620 [Candidatus Delongbacteria bacterium]|nr:hypothetical protein [Candidatus Delongbacteria bacterium]
MRKQIIQIILVIIFQIVSINLAAAYFVNEPQIDIKKVQVKELQKQKAKFKYKLKKGFHRSLNSLLQ